MTKTWLQTQDGKKFDAAVMNGKLHIVAHCPYCIFRNHQVLREIVDFAKNELGLLHQVLANGEKLPIVVIQGSQPVIVVEPKEGYDWTGRTGDPCTWAPKIEWVEWAFPKRVFGELE